MNGSARDADGAVHHVSVDPAFLLVHMLESDVAPFFTTGELAAATEALERGDSAPLLRLAAENDTPIRFDSGPATGFSWGAFVATFCTENRYAWAPEASLDQRVAQWDAAAAESEPAAGRGRRRDRRIVRVAVDAALDALKRSQAGGGAGPGLRGGSFTTELPDGAAVVTLRRVRFASDVAGTVRRGDDAALEAVLTIDGPGGRDGTLRVRGRWLAPGGPHRSATAGRSATGTSRAPRRPGRCKRGGAASPPHR